MTSTKGHQGDRQRDFLVPLSRLSPPGTGQGGQMSRLSLLSRS